MARKKNAWEEAQGLLGRLSQGIGKNVGNYFNPNTAYKASPRAGLAGNFWNTRLAQGLANVQREAQNPRRVNLQQYTQGIQSPIPRVGAQVVAGIGEEFINTPARILSAGNRLGTDARNYSQGQRITPQRFIGTAAAVAEPLFDMATLGGGSLIKSGVKVAAKQGFKSAVRTGILKGAGYGSIYGGLRGASEGNEAKLDTTLKSLIQGGGIGAVLGGATAGAGNIGGRLFNRLRGITSEYGTTPQKYLRNRLGQFTSGKRETFRITPAQRSSWARINKELGRPADTPVYPEDVSRAIDKRLGLDKLKDEGGYIKFGAKIGGKKKSLPRLPSQQESPQIEELQPQSQAPVPQTNVSGGGSVGVPPQSPVGPSDSSRGIITQKYAYNINKKRLDLSAGEKETLDSVVKTVKPELESLRGKTLGNQEIVKAAKTSEYLQKITTREETLAAEAAMLKARQRLVSLDKNIDKLSKSGNTKQLQNEMREMIDSLKVVSSNAADRGRKLQALKIGAEDESVRMQILKEISKTNKNTDDILREAAKVDWNDANSVTKFYRKFIKPSLSEILDEYRYNNMLSNPRTHIRNAFSNLTQTFVTRPATLVFEGRPVEAARYLGGAVKSFPQAVDDFVKSFRGKTGIAKPDIEMIGTDKLPRFMTIPTRAMEAGDKFFTALIRGGELARGSTNESAEAVAQYSLFRQGLHPKGQGWVLNRIDDITGWTYKSPKPVRWFAPFIRTPANFAKQWIEYSPAGFSTLIKAGNKREQLAKAMLGSSVTALGAGLALQERTTWEAPTNAKEKEAFYASGRKPFSVEVGGKWVPMITAGPFAWALALPAAVKYYQDESKESITDSQMEKLTKISTSMAKFMSGQTFLTGIGNFVNWVSGDADYSLPSNLAFTAGQLVPMQGLVRYISTIVDPVFRKPKGFIESFQKDVPFLSKSLPAYTTPTGEEAKREKINYLTPYDIGSPDESSEKDYQTLLDIGKLNRKSSFEKQESNDEATKLYESMKELPVDQANQQFAELVKTDKAMAKKIVEMIKDEKLGLTSTDKAIKSLGVEDGGRAKFLYQEFEKLTSQAEKKQLWEDMVKKKIITKDVAKQLIYLIKNNGSTQ